MASPTAPHQKLENALDRIIAAEVAYRVGSGGRRPDVRDVEAELERVNREIVRAHQSGATTKKLPRIFATALQLQEEGRLHLRESETPLSIHKRYQGRVGRFQALMSAALHAQPDSIVTAIIQDRRRTFDQVLAHTREINALLEEADTLWKGLPGSRLFRPRDEDEAMAVLESLAASRFRLAEIESRHAALSGEKGLERPLERMRRSLNRASKSIAAQGRRSARFIMDQAASTYKMYQNTPAEVSRIDGIADLKETLERYRDLFDSLGEAGRRDQIKGFIDTLDATISRLHARIDRKKEAETLLSDRNEKAVDAAYGIFLQIKQQFADGGLSDGRSRRNALARLRKSIDMLKSNGQRVRAREIERFINATGMGGAEAPLADPAILWAGYRFYRRAFFALLPVTGALALFCLYLLSRPA